VMDSLKERGVACKQAACRLKWRHGGTEHEADVSTCVAAVSALLPVYFYCYFILDTMIMWHDVDVGTISEKLLGCKS
jgi:hypothetical protein